MSKLDDIFDNILYEKPVFDEEDLQPNKLNIESSIVLLSLIQHTLLSSSNTNILNQQILVQLGAILEKHTNWGVTLISLLLRSSIEFGIMKKMERAMNQIEKIYEEWHSVKTPLYERTKYCFCIGFPSYNQIIKEFSGYYAKNGSFMSAAALLKDCGMYEEAMQCMAIAKNQDQALIIFNSLPEARQ